MVPPNNSTEFMCRAREAHRLAREADSPVARSAYREIARQYQRLARFPDFAAIKKVSNKPISAEGDTQDQNSDRAQQLDGWVNEGGARAADA